MSKVITFSRTFPAYHPKAGQPTYFVEQIWNGLIDNSFKIDYAKICTFNNELSPDILWPFWKAINIGFSGLGVKHHTIRSGNRWKVGDKFSPRVWSGKPYKSKQIIIAPDIEVKKVWEFEIDANGIYIINDTYVGFKKEELLAKNDGLTVDELQHWFIPSMKKHKPFSGQIICWNENINY